MSIYKKLLFSSILIIVSIISGCSSEKMPENEELLREEISKMNKKYKKLDEVKHFDKRLDLKEKISKYKRKRAEVMWEKALFIEKEGKKYYVNKKTKKVFYITALGVVNDKNMPNRLLYTYEGKLNKKKEKKTYVAGKEWGKEEVTYKLEKGKLCKYSRQTALIDLNSNNLTYMMIKPYKGKMKRTCYSK